MPSVEEILAGVEGLDDSVRESLTRGFGSIAEELKAKSESDLAALRSTKDGELTKLQRELELAKAPDKGPSSEADASRQALERKYEREDAEKAREAAVASALKDRDDLWSARIKAAQTGVPENALEHCETARDIRMVTATYAALKPAKDGKDVPPGAGSRSTSQTLGEDALDRMSGWMAKNMGPMNPNPR